MRVQHDPGALNNQMDVAATPNELLELAKQVALDVETTREWAAWHTLSIDLAFGLFPETRIELRALGTSHSGSALALATAADEIVAYLMDPEAERERVGELRTLLAEMLRFPLTVVSGGTS